MLGRERARFVEAGHGELARRAFTASRLEGAENLYEHLELQHGDAEELSLRRLNRRSFAAENRASADALAPLLADDFRIARSTWIVQDKAQTLEQVATDTSGRRRELSHEEVRRWGEHAVITSRVTLRQADGQVAGRFWNTKVCVRREGGWQCTAWQVARISD